MNNYEQLVTLFYGWCWPKICGRAVQLPDVAIPAQNLEIGRIESPRPVLRYRLDVIDMQWRLASAGIAAQFAPRSAAVALGVFC